MSTNKTQNYQLHAWEPEDDFRLPEINENFAALDQILTTKTRKEVGAYTGTGKCEKANPNRLTFEFPPVLLIVQSDSFVGLFMRGCPVGHVFSADGQSVLQTVTWEENAVSWYANRWYTNKGSYYTSLSGVAQLNKEGETYTYIALG